METLVGMEASHSGTGHQSGGVDIALPMVACNDAALAVDIATGKDGVGLVGCQFGEEQGGTPAEDGVAGGVGAVGAEPGFVWGRWWAR